MERHREHTEETKLRGEALPPDVLKVIVGEEEQQEPKPPPHIKEEQEELWSSQEGEQLQGLEEADITKFPFIPVAVKIEDDEEEAQSSQLHQRQTQHMETEADGEDCGGPEPARNSHLLLQPETEDQTGDPSEPETDDSADWKETREPQSALNSLKHDSRCKKTFSCSECGRRFGTKAHLKAHMMTHTGEQPFSCSVRKKSFTQSGDLQKRISRDYQGRENELRPCERDISFSSRDIMVRKRAKHNSCSVFGCTDEHKSLFLVPSPEPLKNQWVNFILSGNAPTQLPKVLYVCAKHFTDDCFLNLGQYRAGLAERLKIKSGSVPTLLGSATNFGQASASSAYVQLPRSRDVACQTDHLETYTVGTQLSLKTPLPQFRSEGVQATVSCKDFGVGPSNADPLCLSSAPIQRPPKRPRLDLDEELEDNPLEGSSVVEALKGQDPTYDPADSIAASLDSTLKSDDSSAPTHNSKKYIVYENCIMELFNVCPVCTRACDVKTQRLGTFLSVKQRCLHCTFTRHWNSQPVLGSTPAGDLHLSAALYLSGASFTRIEKVFKAMKLQLFGHETFRRHARSFIEPAVIHHWKVTQDVNLQRLSQEEKVTLGGDMRADSPGHSAKYGSYTMMDLHTNTVVDIQLVQSNEVGGSSHMEKEGLTRSLALLESRGVDLDCIVTDRHPRVQEFLRERNITHYYDVRHMAKGISKKLEAISKQKDCEELKKWLKSIDDHIHWTAAGSTSGPERIAKWTAILNHVRDVHTHEDPLYPECEHVIRKTTDKRKWLQAATPAFYKLEKLLTNKRTLKDVANLSPHHQTSWLEAFRAVVLRFAPKNVVFPFIGMLCRLYLAAMHYNENVDGPQAETEEGEPLLKISFPKARKGECRANPQKTQPTFGYVADMMDLIFEKVFVNPTPYTAALLAIPVPEDLSAQYEKADSLNPT
ncbi:uncharacterized protein LOC144528551 isoform X1 [Sander vitreus]